MCILFSLHDLGQDDSYDFGTGAGFYVNATEKPWAHNYQMYDYVTKELPELINALFPVDTSRRSVCGHSMGGHGALICHLKNPGTYTSVRQIFPHKPSKILGTTIALFWPTFTRFSKHPNPICQKLVCNK